MDAPQIQQSPQLLRQIPFKNEHENEWYGMRKLISFANSIVCNSFCSGQRFPSVNPSEPDVHLAFNDFKEPHAIQYTVSLCEAHDVFRYTAALSLTESIKHDEEFLEAIARNGLSESFSELAPQLTRERLETMRARLQSLHVSPDLASINPVLQLSHLPRTPTIAPDDNATAQVIKTTQIIQNLEKLKYDKVALLHLALFRLFTYWNCNDLNPQTEKDHSRDLETIKKNRQLFLQILSEDDRDSLWKINGLPLIKKPVPSIFEFIDKLIAIHKSNRHLVPDSPRNSDEEIY